MDYEDIYDDRDDMYSSISKGSTITDKVQEKQQQFGVFNGKPITYPMQEYGGVPHYLDTYADNRSTTSSKRKRYTKEDEQETMTVPLSEVIETQVKNNNDIAKDIEESAKPMCWGCRNGVLSGPTIQSNIKGFSIMAKFIKEFLFKIGTDALEKQIQNIYNEHLKEPVAKSLGEEPEEWTLASIRHHLTFCICDPAISTRYKLHDFETVYKQSSGNVMGMKNCDINNLEVQEKELKKMGYSTEVICKLYGQKVNSSPAFNTDVTPPSDPGKQKLSHLNRTCL
jgi:hypothetical protein